MEQKALSVRSVSEKQIRQFILEQFCYEPDKFMKMLDVINKAYLGKFVNFFYASITNGSLGYRRLENKFYSEIDIQKIEGLNLVAKVGNIMELSGSVMGELIAHSDNYFGSEVPDVSEIMPVFSEWTNGSESKDEMINVYFDILGVLRKFDSMVMVDLFNKEEEDEVSYMYIINKHDHLELIVY